jgi:hypothetical protein
MDEQHLQQLKSADPAQRKAAIIAAGKAKDRAALSILAHLYRHDPVPELRELAGKAGRYIHKETSELPAVIEAPEPEPTPPAAEPEPESTAPENDYPPLADLAPEPKSTVTTTVDHPAAKPAQPFVDDKAAVEAFKRARDLHRKNDWIGAAKALGQALGIDPALRDDSSMAALAAKITGKNPDEAIETLADFDAREVFIRQRGQRARRGGVPTFALVIGAAVLVLIVSIIGAVLISRDVLSQLDVGRLVMTGGASTFERTVDRDPSITYHLVVPPGELPESGWPTLVAVHGDGQTGADMVNLFGDAARANQVMLIAPTFPDLSQASYTDARRILLLTLDDIEVRMFEAPNVLAHILGEVYFGQAEGARFVSGTMQQGLGFSDVGFAMNAPLGVALAPDDTNLFEPSDWALGIPYLITAGADAPQADSVTRYADYLTGRGFSVDLQVVPGDGQTITPEQVNATMQFVQEVYGG